MVGRWPIARDLIKQARFDEAHTIALTAHHPEAQWFLNLQQKHNFQTQEQLVRNTFCPVIILTQIYKVNSIDCGIRCFQLLLLVEHEKRNSDWTINQIRKRWIGASTSVRSLS